jgi:nuclear transcription factor Y, gamma
LLSSFFLDLFLLSVLLVSLILSTCTPCHSAHKFSQLRSYGISQAQAQAMVQAAAQAQAVVAAAKSRGDGLVPMNQSQIAALSQIQAQAIVHARKSQGTPQQIQTQIQLQAQALIHAHTQAQTAAGIYKGDESPAPAPASKNLPVPVAAAPTPTSLPAPSSIESRPSMVPNPVMASTPAPLASETRPSASVVGDAGNGSGMVVSADGLVTHAPAPSSSSPEFLAQLGGSLDKFWKEQLQSVHELKEQTEQDFKTHNDLPLARIKRIMKSDEDVRMISAEAPVLFAKACELFILDLSIRSWNYSQLHKRRTLQKEDIREAIQKTDIFDFLVDVI